MVFRKDELEIQLKDEHKMIQEGTIRDDSPLDVSDEFQKLCDACRVGDLKSCQESIATGVNINARDKFDYTPLILASLCGHYEVVRHLLESGALCERDTFQGERCLYNALNDRIRNLLLVYDYSKSTDPLQPFASHVSSLLTKPTPKTSDITLYTASKSWNLHKLVISARSSYFSKKLAAAPDTTTWRLASIPAEAYEVAIQYLYLGAVPTDLGISSESSVNVDDILTGVDKVSKQLGIESLWESILSGNDRRLARQRHQDEVSAGRDQIEKWYRENVLKYKLEVDSSKAQDVRWTRDNGIFADVLLCANRASGEEKPNSGQNTPKAMDTLGPMNGIPIGPAPPSRSPSATRKTKSSVLFPVHRAMLVRSEYFQTMFTSQFQEAQVTEYLQIIPVDCTPEVLEIILDYLYTEKADIPIELAIDVLFAADMLFIEKLKTKAAIIIATIGNGTSGLADPTHNEAEEVEAEPINVYDVIRAAWDLKIHRLETFSARYLAYRLENYIDEEEFEELIQESASRIKERQDTDTIELLDDIRYYLSERFRLRFEDSGLDEIMDECGELSAEAEKATFESPAPAAANGDGSKIHTSHSEDFQSSNIAHVVSYPTLTPAIPAGVRTLDGEIAGDEFTADAVNYQVLLAKIDMMLERLKLDA